MNLPAWRLFNIKDSHEIIGDIIMLSRYYAIGLFWKASVSIVKNVRKRGVTIQIFTPMFLFSTAVSLCLYDHFP